MNRTDKLWKALRLRGASPMPPAAAVQKRIDQALGENSRLEERRKQMKMRKKAAALALAATPSLKGIRPLRSPWRTTNPVRSATAILP